MTAHRAVIAAGPATLRRLCCDAAEHSDIGVAALEAIDDPVGLLDELPVAVDVLWSAALRSLVDGHGDDAIVVHPSWWPATRVSVITTAAGTLGGVVSVRARPWLFATSTRSEAEPMVSVEIADRLVAIIGSDVVAVPRSEPRVVEQVVDAVVALTPTGRVLIDAPSRVTGATQLAKSLATSIGAERVVELDDTRLARLAMAVDAPRTPTPASSASRARTSTRVIGTAVVATGLALAVPTVTTQGPRRVPVTQPAPTTVLVEGRVALSVPSAWIAQRVLSGSGSARVQVNSPADPEVAIHLTQSPTPGETLSGAADRLRRAIDAEPAGVFVDFDRSAVRAGRPAVTYREVRATHDVRWTVLIDGSVRISIGCQSPTGDPATVRDACEQAVRSAHVLD
ncbi:type VII secretion-associated protein [Mycobacterium vicinigordonae]|uniref:Type VII secretion-associated protein n=1 Tax=Mycobacterium vicinigordonae TaxID=1719132 RepID=A0A7D6ITD4_9MYCO|nr:type VII secretion-associated protein [Mycobacterium vicinigordonae]QLL08399.1 type VII secretion-associated protein [Mycobacterium vicinigordonae]